MNDNAKKDRPSRPGLGRLALRGTMFEIGAHGTSLVLRLGGNVVLSRLLFPKAFGLSAEIALVLYGLTMLSDVGIRQCVIQSPRGEDRDFLNTAFTMQVVRGVVLSVIAAGLSWPAAYGWFREPTLQPLLLATSLQLLFGGFHSTGVLSLRRRLRLGWLNVLDLSQQIVSLLVMVTYALIHPSVWALVVGTLSGSMFYTIASHALPSGYRNRFRWDPTAFRELTGFGRWIFASSSVSFFGTQGDRAVFGRLMGARALGVYQIAVELCGTASSVVDRLIANVLYPAFSHTDRSSPSYVSDFRQLYYRARLALDLLAQSGLGLLCGVGPWLVRLIWDSRYWGAGWMLRILCLRAAIICIASPAEACFTAFGMPRFGFWRSVLRAAMIWTALPLGYYLGGVSGLLWATALSELPTLVLLWPNLRKLGILRIDREALALVFFSTSLGIGLLLCRYLPDVHLLHRH